MLIKTSLFANSITDLVTLGIMICIVYSTHRFIYPLGCFKVKVTDTELSCQSFNVLNGLLFGMTIHTGPNFCVVPSPLPRSSQGQSHINLELSCKNLGAQWLSGRVLDSRLRGCKLEPHWRHCVVSLSKTH